MKMLKIVVERIDRRISVMLRIAVFFVTETAILQHPKLHCLGLCHHHCFRHSLLPLFPLLNSFAQAFFEKQNFIKKSKMLSLTFFFPVTY